MTHNDFMKLAVEEALKCSSEVPVGAVITCNGEIIAIASNKKELLKDVTAHAEILAIKDASGKLENWRLEDCELYVTLEPCPMCAAAIVYSRIKTVYFGAYDNLYGAFGSVMDMRKILKSKTQVLGGIEEEKCSELITSFFRSKNG